MTTKSFKVIIIGDTNTGKTSVIYRYTRNSYPQAHFTTPMPIEHVINADNNCQLDIWDTAGMQEWQSSNKVIYHNVHAIILLCSYDEQKSLADLRDFWIPTLSKHLDMEKIPIFLAINKSDLPEEEHIIEENEIEQIESEIKPYKSFIVSAYENKNIAELFHAVADKLSADNINLANDNNVNVNGDNEASRKSKCCSWF